MGCAVSLFPLPSRICLSVFSLALSLSPLTLSDPSLFLFSPLTLFDLSLSLSLCFSLSLSQCLFWFGWKRLSPTKKSLLLVISVVAYSFLSLFFSLFSLSLICLCFSLSVSKSVFWFVWKVLNVDLKIT